MSIGAICGFPAARLDVLYAIRGFHYLASHCDTLCMLRLFLASEAKKKTRAETRHKVEKRRRVRNRKGHSKRRAKADLATVSLQQLRLAAQTGIYFSSFLLRALFCYLSFSPFIRYCKVHLFEPNGADPTQTKTAN